MKTNLNLSDRERQVLTLLATGNSTLSTASALGISAETVKTHRKNILLKLGAKNIAHATSIGINNEIISTKFDIAKVP
ncbi:MAG: helix-turn-helix transcriptional regulator [Taibaiella sp.]|nr:helix-turn-helix transcriptional regulator [Taibaiella sp.]